MFRTINERMAVAGQIGPADVAEAAKGGYNTVVNNRPDGEAPDQPPGEAIAAAAAAAGLDYHYLPVAPGGLSIDTVAALRSLLDDPTRRILAFCRSGTRSTNVWALAAAMAGGDPQAIIGQAAAAGYDVSALAATLHQLAARAEGRAAR